MKDIDFKSGLDSKYIERIIFKKNPYSIIIIFKSGNILEAQSPNKKIWQNLMDEAINKQIRIEL